MVVGELDLSTVGTLSGALEASRHEGAVELDLEQLEFADLAGLGCVLEWLERSRREGWKLEVGAQLSPQVVRLVALTGVGSLLWPRSTDLRLDEPGTGSQDEP